MHCTANFGTGPSRVEVHSPRHISEIQGTKLSTRKGTDRTDLAEVSEVGERVVMWQRMVKEDGFELVSGEIRE